MTSLKSRFDALGDYLDEQAWWQRCYWPIYRFNALYGPRTLYLEAKYFIQRGRRGYSDRDLWDLNYHMARQVLAFLDTNRVGLTFGGFHPDEDDAKTVKRHRRVEAEIRWLMEQEIAYYEVWPDGFFEAGRSPEYQARLKRANRLFGQHWMSLWD